MADGGRGNDLAARVGLWGGNAAGVYELGKLYVKGDPFYEWQIGSTKEHCTTCKALNGVVRTKSEWAKTPYRPQGRNGALECGGWNCKCSWIEVKGPSKGSMP